MEKENPAPIKQKSLSFMLFRAIGLLFRFTIFVGVSAATIMISYYWITNRPQTERRPPRSEAVLVEVQPVRLKTEQVVLRTMGSVVPAARIQLAARVTGQITAISPAFAPGGVFAADAMILQVDQRDYELAVAQQEGNLTRAEADVRIEMGQQSVARSEYELLMDTIDMPDLELLLRKPQLASREAAVEIARNALDKAKLDLERTAIRAPFNAVVLARSVELGAYVSPGISLATLAGTDEFWIEVSVPVNDLAWITIPDAEDAVGAVARVYHPTAWGNEFYRTGHVQRLLPELEAQGRMARVLITVQDPLLLNSVEPQEHKLLLDSFVRVLIEGREVPDVARIPRTWLHEGDTVWVMTSENTLDIRQSTVIWGADDEVLISEGLRAGDTIVTSALAAPVQGMLLRTANQEGNKKGQGQQRQGNPS